MVLSLPGAKVLRSESSCYQGQEGRRGSVRVRVRVRVSVSVTARVRVSARVTVTDRDRI